VIIPLPETIRWSQLVPKQTEYLLNLLKIGAVVVSRPATELVTAKLDEPRGLFEFGGVLYGIWGDKLYRDTALNLVGDIGGIGQTAYAGGFNHAAIVTGTAGANYTVAGSVLTPIADPDVPACRDVEHIDGRFVYVPTDGSPALWSEVGDAANVDPLSFFDEETQPDGNTAVIAIGGDLRLMGAETIGRFRNVGPAENPFQWVRGGTIDVGFVGGKVRARESCLFVGKEKQAGYDIYAFADGKTQPITTPAIKEMLNRLYTPAQLAAVRAQRFNWRGADCYVFEFPDRTLLFQGGLWHYIDSGLTGVAKLGTFRYYNATLFNGTWYVQGTGGLYRLTDAHQDSAGKFSRQIVTFARSGEEAPFDLGELELALANGVGEGTVGLAISRDGAQWGDPWYRDTGAVGARTQRLVWNPPGGLGSFDGYAGLALYATADVEFAADGLVVR